MTAFRFREKEFWILISSGLVLFYQPLLFGETFFFRDLYLHFFPQKLRFVSLVRSGQFPLWDSYLHGGQPFLADLNNMALYPANLLYLILSPIWAFNFDIIFHVLLCAASAYALARALGVSPISSMVAGAVYGFCGYTLSLTNMLNRLTAMPYLPLMLLAVQHLFTGRRVRWFVIAVLFGVLQVLAGAPEMTLLSFVTVLGWMIFSDWQTRQSRRLSIYFAIGLLVAGISAVQILPTAEMMQQSVRSGEASSDYDSFSAWSLHLKRFPEGVFPGFFGHTDRVSKKDYWGSAFESMGFPFILSIYFGWFALSLAIFGAAAKPRRLCRFLAALALFALFFSIGRYLPGFKALYESVPFVAILRYPIKVLAVALLPIALLAALGLDRILLWAERRKQVALYFWISAGLFVALASAFHFSREFASWFMNGYFHQSTGVAVSGVRSSMMHTALIALLAACVYQFSILKTGRESFGIPHTVLAVIILFDLIRSGFGVVHFAPAEFFTKQPEVVQTVRNEIGDGRFYRTPNPVPLVLKLPANDIRYFYRWHLETLHNYLPAFYSIPILYHEDFDNLAQKELVKISDYLTRDASGARVPLLTAGGVSLLMASGTNSNPALEPLKTIRNSSSELFYLYRNRNFRGHAFFVASAVSVATNEEAFLQIVKPDFDPLNVVYVYGEGIQSSEGQTCKQPELKTIHAGTTRINYRASLDCDRYLYFAQPYYKDWITRVDGNEVPTLRANYAFSASLIKAGEHNIERVYKPRSVTIGFYITVASLALLAVMTIFIGLREHSIFIGR
jgi:hypothetical protein